LMTLELAGIATLDESDEMSISSHEHEIPTRTM
jgi:hypothetical protein